jgi:hypothetical protein
MEYSLIFRESEYYPISDLSELNFNFLSSKGLISKNGNNFQSNFVGEVISPESSFFSVPKNFNKDKRNVELFKKVLDTFSYFKKDGKTLLLNDEFTISESSGVRSEKFYFNELKEFFLDYISYEFIYPTKYKMLHSKLPLKGKVDVYNTVLNLKEKGTGVTYKVKDIKNSDDWNMDDIYWSTIKYLTEKWGNQNDKSDIYDMFNFLSEEGYEIKEIDISNNSQIIEDIDKSEVGVIHQPIKNTLLNYFKSKLVKEKIKVKIFYTKYFQYVWEEIVRISFFHSKEFEKELIGNFNNIEIESRWVPNSRLEDFLRRNPKATQSGSNKNIVEWGTTNLRPDLFSQIKRNGVIIRFIGDAKYYNNIDSDYSKEMNEYNNAMVNRYPMCIFVPSDKTTVYRRRRDSQNHKEIIIFKISVEEAIEDSINIIKGIDSFNSINKVHDLIYKFTNRKTEETGFNKLTK